MDDKYIRARLAHALNTELDSGNWGDGFFCRWFAQRRLAWTKDDNWGRFHRLYDPEMTPARLRAFPAAVRELLAAEKRLPVSKEKAERLLAQMEAHPAQGPADRLHTLVLNAYALRDARIYYYDTFDPGRKKSWDLELLDAFCAHSALTLQQAGAASGGRLSEEERRDWDALVALLREEDQQNVFLPICADPHSGAGLYLVGLAYVPWADALKRRRHLESCYYFFLTPSDLTGTEEDEDGDAPSLCLHMEQVRKMGEEIHLEDYDFPSTGEAERWFWGTAAPGVAAELANWNDQAPAGCPKRFLDRFFTAPAKPSWEEHTPSRAEFATLGQESFAAGY